MKKLLITKEKFNKSSYFQKKYGKLKYVSESGKIYKTNKGNLLKFLESDDLEEVVQDAIREGDLDDAEKAELEDWLDGNVSDNKVRGLIRRLLGKSAKEEPRMFCVKYGWNNEKPDIQLIKAVSLKEAKDKANEWMDGRTGGQGGMRWPDEWKIGVATDEDISSALREVEEYRSRNIVATYKVTRVWSMPKKKRGKAGKTQFMPNPEDLPDTEDLGKKSYELHIWDGDDPQKRAEQKAEFLQNDWHNYGIDDDNGFEFKTLFELIDVEQADSKVTVDDIAI